MTIKEKREGEKREIGNKVPAIWSPCFTFSEGTF